MALFCSLWRMEQKMGQMGRGGVWVNGRECNSNFITGQLGSNQFIYLASIAPKTQSRRNWSWKIMKRTWRRWLNSTLKQQVCAVVLCEVEACFWGAFWALLPHKFLEDVKVKKPNQENVVNQQVGREQCHVILVGFGRNIYRLGARGWNKKARQFTVDILCNLSIGKSLQPFSFYHHTYRWWQIFLDVIPPANFTDGFLCYSQRQTAKTSVYPKKGK